MKPIYTKSEMQARVNRAKALENLDAAAQHLAKVCAYLSTMSATTEEWETAGHIHESARILWCDLNKKRGIDIDLDDFGKKLYAEMEAMKTETGKPGYGKTSKAAKQGGDDS